jgi:hypothetical protein
MALRQGSFALAAVIAIGALLRLAGPATTTSASRPTEASKRDESAKGARSSYLADVERTVQQFFGVENDPAETLDPKASWNLPGSRNRVRFVVAILPDPVHTHLALFFDRSIEALQQAAQREGYVFDRFILPWDYNPHQNTDLEKRQRETEEQRIRESYPGLLIFREGLARRQAREKRELAAAGRQDPNANQPNPHGESLFVLVVGETPTGGLRKQQFSYGLWLMGKIRGINVRCADPLLILGPTFSGSLESLKQELASNVAGLRCFPEAFIYSGTITKKESMEQFEKPLDSLRLHWLHFASFQQNDQYLIERFADFACAQNYEVGEIAVLSEDGTVFGDQSSPLTAPICTSSWLNRYFPSWFDPPRSQEVVLPHFYFPREISFFRSAYQKAVAAQPNPETKPPGRSTLTLDLGDTGSEDDSVAPYGGLQTPLSQEAVMLGLVSELQKHHIVFTVLFATNPVDELFLARYLRTAYPQGRVVITTPDLLFSREEDTLLRGVLGLNSYAMAPGLNDRLCQQEESNVHEHEERLFVSSSSVGIYNATIGLLALQKAENSAVSAKHSDCTVVRNDETLPGGPYNEYASLPMVMVGNTCPAPTTGQQSCRQYPLLWLTILGRDGFWPIAPLDKEGLQSNHSTMKLTADVPAPYSNDLPLATPGAWNIAYSLCVLLMLIHAALSWTGSILANSESSAQFAKNKDGRDTFIVAIGALALWVASVALMCARSPFLCWKGSWPLTIALWLPLLLFVAVTAWDVAKRRGQRTVAIAFLAFSALISMYLLAFDMPPRSQIYWLPRVVHLASGVSPVLPLLLLLGAGYWWMWQSLRGVTLVDLRRPRLPEKNDLPPDVYRISEADGEKLRQTAHPFFFEWQVLIPVVVLVAVSATVVDLDHPVQTMEGLAYDIGYSLMLIVMIASFLGCLLKLVRTWFECRHILGGLDRLPLREAFSRMKNLSWRSMWNPGGSTLRETYKLMSRALENLDRLRLVLKEDQSTSPLPLALRDKADIAIGETMKARDLVQSIYVKMSVDDARSIDLEDIEHTAKEAKLDVGPIKGMAWWRSRETEAERILMVGVEFLQKKMAKTAAVLMVDILKTFWEKERSPVVSEDIRARDSRADDPKSQKTELPLCRLLTEEYVTLIYANFLVTVLLRMRTMVLCAVGMYVFIILSINTYPFEPHPALQTLGVVMLVLLGAAVGYVYAEMHREAILSRLTSTGTGELGWDFWLKFASAAAIPVFSLLATQFPGINQVLFSWLEPALQAVK